MQQPVEAAAPLPDKPAKKLNFNASRTKMLVAAIVLLTALAAVAPFYYSRYDRTPDGHRTRRLIATHDLWMHLHTMEQFDKGLRSGVIYPRWVADINHGYGILTLIYYPPGFFYLTSAVHAVFSDWLDTLFVITVLALAASGIALYHLARMFYGVLASVVAALFYMILPMHMLDLYWRGGLPQFIGYVFPPLIIYFGYKLGRGGRPVDYAGLAVCYGLHLLIHLPVSLMFTYALAFWAVVWALKEKNWRIGARLTGAMALGLLLSAIYWLPAALESKYAYEFASDLFPYHQSYITLLPVADGNPYYDLWRLLNDIFAFNALALIITILVVRAARKPGQTGGAATREWTPLGMWITMGIATLMMGTSFSFYISRLLPKIQITVPAWRWLALAGVFTSLLVAAAVDWVRQRDALGPRLLWACRAAVVLVIALNVWLSIKWSIIRPLSNPTYNHLTTSSVVESSWTPKNATHPQELADTPPVVIEPQGAAVEISRWDPQYREVHVRVTEPSTVRLKTYNFPGWTARVDGGAAPISSDRDGVQQIDVPPGLHKIQVSFENTPPRTAGAALSGLAAAMIAGLFFLDRLKGKRRR